MFTAQGREHLCLDLMVGLEGHVHERPDAVQAEGGVFAAGQATQHLHRTALQDWLNGKLELCPGF